MVSKSPVLIGVQIRALSAEAGSEGSSACTLRHPLPRKGLQSLTRQIRVINGNIPDPSVVEHLQLGTVRGCDVGKVLSVVGVDLLGIGST